MTIDAIVGDVGDAVLEPFDRHVVRVEGNVLDLGIGLEPLDALAVLAPERIRVLQGVRVHLFVLRRVDPGALGPIDGNLIDLLGHELLSRRRTRLRCFPATIYASKEARATSATPSGFGRNLFGGGGTRLLSGPPPVLPCARSRRAAWPRPRCAR